jgi:hypothetical protein
MRMSFFVSWYVVYWYSYLNIPCSNLGADKFISKNHILEATFFGKVLKLLLHNINQYFSSWTGCFHDLACLISCQESSSFKHESHSPQNAFNCDTERKVETKRLCCMLTLCKLHRQFQLLLHLTGYVSWASVLSSCAKGIPRHYSGHLEYSHHGLRFSRRSVWRWLSCGL